MANDYDARTSVAGQVIVTHLDELRPNAVPLLFRNDRHRAERRTIDVAYPRATVHDVTDDLPQLGRHERQQRAAIGSQGIDDVTFSLLTERTAIDFANGREVSRGFRSDFDHVVECPPSVSVHPRRFTDISDLAS